MRKATPSDTVRYVYDGQQMLLVTDDDHTPQQHYTWGAKRPLAMDDTTDGPQYYLLDALGSVVGLSHPDGSLQSRTQYDAWGQPHATTGTSANRLGFTGHERDTDSGLYYAKARYYDPSLGSFLSTDPATADLMNPPSFHPYLYAYANPTVYIDPDGRNTAAVFQLLKQLPTAVKVITGVVGLIVYGKAVEETAQLGARLAEESQQTQEVVESPQGPGEKRVSVPEPATQAAVAFEATSLGTAPPPFMAVQLPSGGQVPGFAAQPQPGLTLPGFAAEPPVVLGQRPGQLPGFAATPPVLEQFRLPGFTGEELRPEDTLILSVPVEGSYGGANKTPLWTATKNKSVAENAYRHFKDHGADFGVQNAVDYTRKAQDFLQNPPAGTLSKTRPNGDVVRFNPATDTFGVMDKTGAPRTFYKPDPAKHGYPTNQDYFNVQ